MSRVAPYMVNGGSACALAVDRSLLREPCFMRADVMQHSFGCMRPSAMP
jgi:hypothetical protein